MCILSPSYLHPDARVTPLTPAGIVLPQSSVNCVMRLGSIFSYQSKYRRSYSTIRLRRQQYILCNSIYATDFARLIQRTREKLANTPSLSSPHVGRIGRGPV